MSGPRGCHMPPFWCIVFFRPLSHQGKAASHRANWVQDNLLQPREVKTTAVAGAASSLNPMSFLLFCTNRLSKKYQFPFYNGSEKQTRTGCLTHICTVVDLFAWGRENVWELPSTVVTVETAHWSLSAQIPTYKVSSLYMASFFICL